MKERSGPRGAHSHLTKRENIPRATGARTSSKKKPALRSGPRGAQSHLTERIKTAPRHQRANLLKEELALMQIKHLYATALLQKSIFNLKECKK